MWCSLLGEIMPLMYSVPFAPENRPVPPATGHKKPLPLEPILKAPLTIREPAGSKRCASNHPATRAGYADHE